MNKYNKSHYSIYKNGACIVEDVCYTKSMAHQKEFLRETHVKPVCVEYLNKITGEVDRRVHIISSCKDAHKIMRNNEIIEAYKYSECIVDGNLIAKEIKALRDSGVLYRHISLQLFGNENYKYRLRDFVEKENIPKKPVSEFCKKQSLKNRDIFPIWEYLKFDFHTEIAIACSVLCKHSGISFAIAQDYMLSKTYNMEKTKIFKILKKMENNEDQRKMFRYWLRTNVVRNLLTNKEVRTNLFDLVSWDFEETNV